MVAFFCELFKRFCTPFDENKADVVPLHLHRSPRRFLFFYIGEGISGGTVLSGKNILPESSC